MPTVTIGLSDLEGLYGRKLPRTADELNELLYQVKCEVSSLSRAEPIQADSELQLENKDTNRPDTWSAEGIARALRGLVGVEKGLKKYPLAAKPVIDVHVDRRLLKIRPYIGCFVAFHPKLNDIVIRGLIHLQEKLDQTYGRRRRRSSIGFYNFDLISPPLSYTVCGPEAVKFVPLEGSEPLSLKQILETHPKGLEYGHIVKHHSKMPILLDAKGKVLSFPPIINSNDLGKVTADTKNILVEITGTSEETVLNSLNILATALGDRGSNLSPAVIRYNYGSAKTVKTPDLNPRRMQVDLELIQRIVGIDLKPSEIQSLLRRSRYEASMSRKTVKVQVPAYRLDVLHPVDIIEDIAIAYGLNRMQPRWPADLTVGGLSSLEEFADVIRELMIGFGFQEILTFIMTTPEDLYGRMNQERAAAVEITNPKIATMTALRSWLLPSLMGFLANNRHVEYPQKLFEVGDCMIWDPKEQTRVRDVRKLACLTAHSKANFTEMKSYLQPFMANLGLDFKIEALSNPSFLEGRAGRIMVGSEDVGMIGEVHPQVIQNWNLEDPVSAMELDVSQAFRIKRHAGGAPKPPTSERAN